MPVADADVSRAGLPTRPCLDSSPFFAQTSLDVTDQREPFDETVAPRSRRRCFFCDVDKSDEWNFVASLNRFVCKKCHDRINETAAVK
jgi:hypothetical protein